MDEWAIEAHKLVKRYGVRTVIDGLNLRVKTGEFLVLFGANGAGKSTLIRILCALMRPSSGTAKVAGHDVTDDPDGVRANVGLLGHSTHLYEDLTARENVRFYLQLHGVDALQSRIDDALKATGLEYAMHQPVRTFSAGMKKRLGIAKLMARPPRVLFLDEPYSSLDQAGVQMLNRFLRTLKAEGHTIFMVTHHQEQGLAAGDRVLALERGRLRPEPRLEPSR